MPADKLTDTTIRRAQPSDKPKKLSDGGGLYLALHPNGARYWRLKYRIAGIEKRRSLGIDPETTLAQARCRRNDARAWIAEGTAPSIERKAAKEVLKANRIRHAPQECATQQELAIQVNLSDRTRRHRLSEQRINFRRTRDKTRSRRHAHQRRSGPRPTDLRAAR